MQKIKCIILEDEEVLLQHLTKYVERVDFLELLATFLRPAEALNFLKANSVDLIFLDLQMPNEEIDGLGLMAVVDSEMNYVITTAHPEYALQSYNFNVIDYLHKPYPFERFLKAVYKVQKQITIQKYDFTEEYLYIKTGKILQKINLNEIYWFESHRNIIRVFTQDDDITFVMTMEDLMAQLPEKKFVRVHRSFIVSFDKINLIHEDYVLVNRNGIDKSIRIGDIFRSGLKSMLEGRVLRSLK
jgi:two-component system LytT family response regulator